MENKHSLTILDDEAAAINEIERLWKMTASILVHSASSCLKTGNGTELLVGASLKRSTNQGTSLILANSEALLRWVFNEEKQEPVQEDTMKILIHHIASRILYETHAHILYLDSEFEWVVHNSEPSTPPLEEIFSDLKKTERDLEVLKYRCDILNALDNKADPELAEEIAVFVSKLWNDPNVASTVQETQAWGFMLDSYIATIQKNISALRRHPDPNLPVQYMSLSNLMGLQLGMVKQYPEKDKCSLIHWLGTFDRTTEGGQALKLAEIHACSLGKEVCLFSSRLFFAVAHNNQLFDGFRRWKLSLSTLVWQRGKLKAGAVLLKRVVEALHFAENQIKQCRRTNHLQQLELKAGKRKMPSNLKKKKLNNTLTEGQLHIEMKEMKEVLGRMKSLLMRLEISLTEPIWLHRAENQTNLISGTVQPFLSQCEEDLLGFTEVYGAEALLLNAHSHVHAHIQELSLRLSVSSNYSFGN